MKEEIKKYEITSSWTLDGSNIEGSTCYATIPELIDAYKKKIKRKDSKIVRISLSCEFSNSLLYTERRTIEKEEYIKLKMELDKAGISDDFVNLHVK